jgi:hypothetical protein
MTSLTVRKLADTSSGTRVKGCDPFTGEPCLVNPETGRHEPWPLAGVEIVGGPPDEITVSTKFVQQGVYEGWVTVEGVKIVHRPGGPPGDVWTTTHTFTHLDAITLHTINGDVRYVVTHQPDKYADPGDDDTPVTDAVYTSGATRVDWFYELKLEGG